MTLSGADATLSINGQAYTLIHSMAQLAALSQPVLNSHGNQVYSDWNGTPVFTTATGYYALAQDLDASGATYSGPVVNTLAGTLAGLGHKVSNLTVNDTNGYGNDGLIGSIGSTTVDVNTGITTVTGVGTVRDIGLVNVKINDTNASGVNTGNDGALAGVSYTGSTVSNAYSINATMTGIFNVGGLVGFNQGVIYNGHTDYVNISALNGGGGYGGLVGQNFGTISNSSAKGNVAAAGILSDGGNGLLNSTDIGGLVGYNAGSIINSHAYVDVSATNSVSVGGLVGTNIAGGSYPGSITGSTATGTLTVTWTYGQAEGENYGGLVGVNYGGAIANSSANVNVNVTVGPAIIDGVAYVAGVQYVGGLVGNNTVGYNSDGSTFSGAVVNSTSYGNVTAIGLGNLTVNGIASNVGGAIGNNDGSISGVQSFGNVKGFSEVGGLIGTNDGDVRNSSASGTVTGVRNVDGLVGADSGTVASSTYHDPAAAAQAAQTAIAATAAANVISTTDAQMTAAVPPSASISTAGKQATAAIAGPKIDDNIEIKERRAATPSSSAGRARHAALSPPPRHAVETEAEAEEPPAPRHVAPPPKPQKAHVKARGAGYGASIRSIEINGQRYNLEDNSAKPGESDQKAQ